MKYTIQEYVDVDMFEDQDAFDVRMQKVKIVKTRKDHECFGCLQNQISHQIPSGSIARSESALIGRSHWGSYYFCIESLDRWLDFIHCVEGEV